MPNKPSTSPTGTSSSTSAPRSCRESLRGDRHGAPTVRRRPGGTPRGFRRRRRPGRHRLWPQGPLHRRPRRRMVGQPFQDRGPLPRLARPRRQVRRPHGAQRGLVVGRRRGQACRRLAQLDGRRGRPVRQLSEGIDPRGRRDPRRAPAIVPPELFDMVSRAPACRAWKSSISEPRHPATVPGGAR